MIIVYDVTNKESFEDLDGYIKEGTRYSERSDKFVVANKLDLADRRVIEAAQGQKLAQSQGLPYLEVSAKTGENVKKLFESVARRLVGAAEPAG
jgi:GTPase SAR1 family protein